MLVSKTYQLVSLKFTKVEIWVKQYLIDVTDTNQYLTNTTNIL